MKTLASLLLLFVALSGCSTTPKDLRPMPKLAPPSEDIAPTNPPNVAPAPWTLRSLPLPITHDPVLLANRASKTSPEHDLITEALPAHAREKEIRSETVLPMDPTNPDSVGGLLARRSIYFDTDSTRVPAPYRALILAHAEWLVHNPSRGVRLSGHCDERGSREYNLSLGERRATAIKALMVLSGVSEEQVQTESFGKEKPVSFGHSELAWARNRRVDIQYGGTR